MRVLTWNLFHGRAKPSAGRPLLAEFAAALAGWDWDVALLQEVPPWWPPALASACGAQERTALTSRNSLRALRRAIASRKPDLLGSWGGGANTILVRGEVGDHRFVVLTRKIERRVSHGVQLLDGGWVVNLHATNDLPPSARAEVAIALRAARAWAAGVPLVFGGDLNLRSPRLEGMRHVAAHHVDHLFVSGWEPVGRGETLDSGTLSDHRPLAATLRPAPQSSVSGDDPERTTDA